MSDRETPSTSWAVWAWNAYREGRLVEAPDPAAIREAALVKQLAEADALIEAQAKDHASNNIRLAETAHRAERLEAALKRVLRNVDEDGVGTVLMIDLIHARAALTQKDRTDGE